MEMIDPSGGPGGKRGPMIVGSGVGVMVGVGVGVMVAVVVSVGV